MKLEEHLSKEQRDKLNDKYKYKSKPKKKHKEHVDWKEIMGMNQQVLKRGKGGALRR